MNDLVIPHLLTALGAYFLGSIPFGLLLVRAAGAGDIRKVGSGNIGATNVLRTGRKGLAAATLLLDGLKGLLAVWLARVVVSGLWMQQTDAPPPGAPTLLVAMIAAVAVVLGHCFPVWLNFRGGKGVATALGVAFGLDWRVGLLCALAWLLAARLTRISSAGALVAIAVLPIALLPLDGGRVALAGLLVAVLVYARHHENIARLAAGTEPRIGQRPVPPPP